MYLHALGKFGRMEASLLCCQTQLILPFEAKDVCFKLTIEIKGAIIRIAASTAPIIVDKRLCNS